MSLILLFLDTSGGPPPVVVDTHDSWKEERKRKKRWDEERKRLEAHKAEIVDAYERLVEGKSPVAVEMAQEFAAKASPKAKSTRPSLDFDRLLARADAVEKLWNAFIELDDEDVLVLM
jgi:hypothetical protein